jgi:hypothetical protein
LPHPLNVASQDVVRISDAIEMIDADVNRFDKVEAAINREKFEEFIQLWSEK